jgi:hypothetical protein
MTRLAVIFFAFAVLACGGQEAGTGDTEAPPVSTEGGAAPGETPTPTVSVDPQVASCLDLVRRAQFQQALPVCLAALDAEPDNQEVSAALDKARSESAKVADAQQAAEGAAAGGASSLDDAKQGLTDQITP